MKKNGRERGKIVLKKGEGREHGEICSSMRVKECKNGVHEFINLTSS